MIDSGALINIMPLGIMKEPCLWVDKAHGKCYAMDARVVQFIKIMKYVDLRLATF